MIIFYIYVINRILDYLSECLSNPACDEMPRDVGSIVVNEPAVSDPLLGVGGRDAILTVQDGAVQDDPACDEVPRSVESTVLNEPALSTDAMAQD